MVASAKNWLSSDKVEIAVRITVIITVIFCLGLFIRQSSLATCQYNYNQAYAEYARNARDTRDSDDKVQDELFKAIYDARTVTDTVAAQKAIDAAFVKYFTTVELTKKNTQNNPPPGLPSSYCG